MHLPAFSRHYHVVQLNEDIRDKHVIDTLQKIYETAVKRVEKIKEELPMNLVRQDTLREFFECLKDHTDVETVEDIKNLILYEEKLMGKRQLRLAHFSGRISHTVFREAFLDIVSQCYRIYLKRWAAPRGSTQDQDCPEVINMPSAMANFLRDITDQSIRRDADRLEAGWNAAKNGVLRFGARIQGTRLKTVGEFDRHQKEFRSEILAIVENLLRYFMTNLFFFITLKKNCEDIGVQIPNMLEIDEFQAHDKVYKVNLRAGISHYLHSMAIEAETQSLKDLWIRCTPK